MYLLSAVKLAASVAIENRVSMVVTYNRYDDENENIEARYGYMPAEAFQLFNKTEEVVLTIDEIGRIVL
jgi:hypothetical protein